MVLKVPVPPNLIGGDVDDGYGKVADAFRRQLRRAGRYRRGCRGLPRRCQGRRPLGRIPQRHHQAPWERDTLVNVFSTTKGVAALAVAVAASHGLIEYDAKVADYWPEFAQTGKGDVTVRQLLSHQAGLPALVPAPALADIADTRRLSTMLAAQPPAWPPGTRHGYHAVTLGWYESELIRHADPPDAHWVGSSPTKWPSHWVSTCTSAYRSQSIGIGSRTCTAGAHPRCCCT